MDKKVTLYPLQFKEVYKQTIWGGDKIYKYKGQEAPAPGIGETWEISAMEGDASVVANGVLAGKNLIEITETYGAELLGQQVYDRFGGRFPLLVKLIDSRQDLSVQVHPNDEYAKARHNSLGKTEMWYILDSDPGAKIYAGWAKETSAEALPELVKSDEVMEYLGSHTPHPGDVFFLPAGRVHTIGAGNLLLEIQQASKITYRLFDFNRTDAEGNKRELHIEDGAKVIDYQVKESGATPYDREATDTPVVLAECDYFRTSMLQLTDDYQMDLSARDSFTILFVDNGAVTVNDTYQLSKGQLLLVPASVEGLKISGKGAKLIESYVPKK
ncbi:MAG: class I mannose-6-phosphate isomerase [Porphyromonas sp.]|nr:class I mannose-6-phosphate isomerase [Porphyromonas sp.]